MGAQTFLSRVTGKLKLLTATLIGGSASYAYLIPCLDANGRLAESMMPSGFGTENYSGTAAEAIGAYKLVGPNATGGIRLADAANAYPCSHFVKEATASGATATCYRTGSMSGFTGLTPGAPVYLSTVGGITQDVSTIEATSGNISQQIGVASSATTVEFEPQEPIYIA